MSMTIEELEIKKKALEHNVSKIIEEFVKETKVKDVSVYGANRTRSMPSGKIENLGVNVCATITIR